MCGSHETLKLTKLKISKGVQKDFQLTAASNYVELYDWLKKLTYAVFFFNQSLARFPALRWLATVSGTFLKKGKLLQEGSKGGIVILLRFTHEFNKIHTSHILLATFNHSFFSSIHASRMSFSCFSRVTH